MAEVKDSPRRPGWPVVLKAVTGGYDGRGVWVCADAEAAASVLAHGLELIAEEYVRFSRELAILVARGAARARRRVPGRGDRAAGRDLPAR